MSQIPSKTVSRIELVKLSQIQSKTLGRIDSVKTRSDTVKNLESNRVGTVELFEISDADDGASDGG